MHRGYSTPLVIAIMAFAIVAFLFLIDTAVNPDGLKRNTNSATANKNTNQVACTDEAKLCPDGSAVGRTGPNCEFAECPTTNSNSSTNQNTNETTDETKDWKTYNNAKLGYSFKYPRTWYTSSFDKATNNPYLVEVTLEEKIRDDQPIRSLKIKTFSEGYGLPQVSSDQYEYLSKETSIIHFIRLMNGLLPEEYFSEARQESKIIGGLEAIRYVRGSIETPWTVKLEGSVFEFDNNFEGTEQQNLVEQILSTFTFTDPTAGWKTYTAPTVGYSFQYPDGLGNAEIQGMMYLGTLDKQLAKDWEANLAIIDTDKETQIMYIYTPAQSAEPGTTLANSIPGAWKNSALYTKSTVTLNGTTFDKYVAIGTPDNNVREGYAVTKANRHYIVSLMDAKITLAQSLMATFTLTD